MEQDDVEVMLDTCIRDVLGHDNGYHDRRS
jgi:hypothetical protein